MTKPRDELNLKLMSDLTLPTLDETWPESVKRAHETFVNMITEQNQQLIKLTQQLEQLKWHIKPLTYSAISAIFLSTKPNSGLSSSIP